LLLSKLAPRNSRANQTTAAPFADKDQTGSSSTSQPRFQFATPINASNIVAVSGASQQGLIATTAGRQQGQKPIQVIIPATTTNGQVINTNQAIPGNQQIIFIQNPAQRSGNIQAIRQPVSANQTPQQLYVLQPQSNGQGQPVRSCF
jgi:hypothetical protein